MEKRLKVLMSAYACEPNRGSEPEVGWQWAMHMARFHDVTVVTRSNNQLVIEAELAAYCEPKPAFLYYDLPRWLVALKKCGLPIAIYYLLWQIGVRRYVRPQLISFDLIHHVTFNSFRQPGFWWFCGRPVILGPLGGGQICPWSFLRQFGMKAFAETFRSLTVFASSFFPHLWLSFAAAHTILVANADTHRRVPVLFRRKVKRMLETGIATDQVAAKPSVSTKGLKIIWVSRLEKIKAPELALRAFTVILEKEPSALLHLVGDGPEEEALKELAVELNVTDATHWHGRVPKSEVARLLTQSDVFLFTSVRDTSGNVLLEAMAAGLPSVTLLHHGAAEITTDATSLRVLPSTFQKTARDIAEAVLKLARSPDLRECLGNAARQRAQEVHSWEKKGEQMDTLYCETVTRND